MVIFTNSYKNESLILLSSTEKILISATECFFQHGYSAANISMIGRHADISRVTIHKQFKSKEVLFRAVVEKYIQDNHTLLAQYTQSTNDFWADTESFLLNRCKGLFDEISSIMIRTDLLHAGQSYCSDIMEENETRVCNSIAIRVTQEIAANRITLHKINISVSAFAHLIETAPFGIALSNLNEDNSEYIKNILKLFKASTLIEQPST